MMSKNPMTPQDFISAWSDATGQMWRIVPQAVHADAKLACDACFTAEEIRLVVNYVRRQITRGEGGYNSQSLLWRVMAADNWAKFQERLSLATEAQHRANAAKPKPPVAVTDAMGTTRLLDAPPKPANLIDVRAALGDLAKEVKTA